MIGLLLMLLITTQYILPFFLNLKTDLLSLVAITKLNEGSPSRCILRIHTHKFLGLVFLGILSATRCMKCSVGLLFFPIVTPE